MPVVNEYTKGVQHRARPSPSTYEKQLLTSVFPKGLFPGQSDEACLSFLGSPNCCAARYISNRREIL